MRFAQFDRFRDEAFRLALSRRIVEGKLVVQRRLLARYARNHPDRLEPECVDQIRQSLALDLVEVFRQPVVDRLTLRLLNRGQLAPNDFEGCDAGLRRAPEAFKRYFGYYEDHLRSPSEGEGSPSWRERLTGIVDELRGMVMEGRVDPVAIWSG